MQTFAVEFPVTSMRVASRDVEIEVNPAELPHEIIRQLLPHAIKQKLADAAASVPFNCYMAAKPEGSPKPSRDQLTDFVAANKATVDAGIMAAMQKAWDAMMEGKWQIRVAADGTSTKWNDEQALALDIAKGVLQTMFAAALAKASPGAKATAANFVAMSPKVAAFFKANDKRPTWNDSAVMDWIKRQLEADKPRDFMREAREELARRASAANDMLGELDDMLGDL